MSKVPAVILMTLSEYQTKVTPILQEFKKFIRRNEHHFFSKSDYYGLNYLTAEEYQTLEQSKMVDSNLNDEVKKSLIEERVKRKFPQGFKVIPAEIIEQRDNYKAALLEFFGDYFYKIEDDEVKSNKRSVRRAIDSRLYLEVILSDELSMERLEEIATSVGVKVPKVLFKENERKEVIKGKLNPIIKEKVDILAAQFKEKIIKDTLVYYKNLLAKWETIKNADRRIIREFESDNQDISWLKRESTTEDFKLQQATREGEGQVQHFRFKMYDKFGGLLPTKHCVKTLEFKGYLYNNTFVITLTNDMKFECYNKIVDNMSILGNPYYQLPTTFGYLVLPNGTTIKQISETDLKKTLNEAYKETK